MKNFLFILILLTIFAACANEDTHQSSNVKTDNATAPLNPNGDSELALLMRKMEKHWKGTKKIIEEGKDIKDLPDFSNIFTATPTDESMTMDDLHGFAENYLQQIKALGNAKGEAQKAAYNNIINGCIMCHENSCSGPIPRIKKLLIKE